MYASNSCRVWNRSRTRSHMRCLICFDVMKYVHSIYAYRCNGTIKKRVKFKTVDNCWRNEGRLANVFVELIKNENTLHRNRWFVNESIWVWKSNRHRGHRNWSLSKGLCHIRISITERSRSHCAIESLIFFLPCCVLLLSSLQFFVSRLLIKQTDMHSIKTRMRVKKAILLVWQPIRCEEIFSWKVLFTCKNIWHYVCLTTKQHSKLFNICKIH